MTDATKLFKGAAALRKGIAMFAWLGDVEAALKEVPELEKTLKSLQEEISVARSKIITIRDELGVLQGSHTSAEAQALKIIDDARAEATTTLDVAESAAAKMISVGKLELSGISGAIEKERAIHFALMIEYTATQDTAQEQIMQLYAELAAIKARL